MKASCCCAARRSGSAGTRDAEAVGVSIIHQELNLIRSFVAANIFLGRERRSALGLLDDRAWNGRRRDCCASWNRNSTPPRRWGGCESATELVEIAKALSLQAEILIMDEPPAR